MKILDKYPVNDKNQIKTASDYLDENILKFQPSDRVKIAKQMREVCTIKKVPMDKNASYNAYFNFCQDGDSKCNPEYLKYNIEDRRVATDGVKISSENGERDTSSVLDEILSLSDKLSISKVAELIESFDIQTDLARSWDSGIVDPFLSVSSNKDGNNANSFDKIANSNFDIIDIHNISCDEKLVKKASSVVDDSICEKFIKNPYDCILKEAAATGILIEELEKIV